LANRNYQGVNFQIEQDDGMVFSESTEPTKNVFVLWQRIESDKIFAHVNQIKNIAHFQDSMFQGDFPSRLSTTRYQPRETVTKIRLPPFFESDDDPALSSEEVEEADTEECEDTPRKICQKCSKPLPKHRSMYCSDFCAIPEHIRKTNEPKKVTRILQKCNFCEHMTFRKSSCGRSACIKLYDNAKGARSRKRTPRRVLPDCQIWVGSSANVVEKIVPMFRKMQTQISRTIPPTHIVILVYLQDAELVAYGILNGTSLVEFCVLEDYRGRGFGQVVLKRLKRHGKLVINRCAPTEIIEYFQKHAKKQRIQYELN
jgi:hypothetical protein